MHKTSVAAQYICHWLDYKLTRDGDGAWRKDEFFPAHDLELKRKSGTVIKGIDV